VERVPALDAHHDDLPVAGGRGPARDLGGRLVEAVEEVDHRVAALGRAPVRGGQEDTELAGVAVADLAPGDGR